MTGLTTNRDDDCLHEIETDTGMQKCYLILSEEERAKGFVRPLRRSYTHLVCGQSTRMGLALCETYARDPNFYRGTYCVTCKAHFHLRGYNAPKPIDGKAGGWGYFFVWDEDGEGVGS